MLAVSDQFKAAVNAVTRNLDVIIRVKAASDADYANARIYSSQNLLLSLKIVDGQTTGGFSLGGTICPSLTAELHQTANVVVGDKIKAELVVYNGGGNLTMASEFTVDNIKRKSDGSLSVTALGDMITLAKNYISELSYPATQLDVLQEISEQTGFPLHPLITHTLINNPGIAKAPIKGKTESGETLYYTRREMLGFAAAINGGAAYIDQYGRIDIARHNDTGETFTHEQVFNESITEPFTVEAVKWSSSGFSYSLGDDYNENTIEFYNPLDYSDKDAIADTLEDDLIGFSYDGVTVKKQGCGYYQVGDIVHYTDISGNSHKLLVLGIVYEFNDGYFTETLHSLTSTETQRQFSGEGKLSNEASKVTGTTSSNLLASYEYVSDNAIKYNGMTYTVSKDDTTGLITKISDSEGAEFSPTVSGTITDVAFHNAVLTAVALLCGLPSEEEKFITANMYSIYDETTLDFDADSQTGIWHNSLSEGYDITLTGGELRYTYWYSRIGEGIVNIPEPDTIYCVYEHGNLSGVYNYSSVISKNMTNTDANHGFDIILSPGYDICLGCRGEVINSEINSNNVTHVICIARSGSNAKLYIDGVLYGSGTAYKGSYNNEYGLNRSIRGGSVADQPTEGTYKFVGFGGEQSEAVIVANSKYLMKQYGVE